MGVIGCGPGTPSPSLAEAEVRASIDEGAGARLQLVSIQKTDGQAAEVMGVKVYKMLFDGEAEFITDALFTTGGAFDLGSSSIKTTEYQRPAPGFSWNEFGASVQGLRRARKGDQLKLSGYVEFERRESGWIAGGVNFTSIVHDSATRDMAAVRAEAERIQAEEQRRKEEEARLAQRIVESKQINRTLGTFKGYPTSESYNYDVSLTVTDAGVKTVFGVGTSPERRPNSRYPTDLIGKEEWTWFGEMYQIHTGTGWTTWRGINPVPIVFGATNAFFANEKERDAYFNVLLTACQAWRAKFPEVVPADKAPC
jgi:hypothetical protein